jgi:hypothetical protein
MKRQLQLNENLPFCHFERREKSFLDVLEPDLAAKLDRHAKQAGDN